MLKVADGISGFSRSGAPDPEACAHAAKPGIRYDGFIMTHPLNPFHLAITVDNLAAARAFYGGLLGCSEGRSDDTWVDFNLLGHQLVCHLDEAKSSRTHENPVDGDAVPVPHFGVVMTMDNWKSLAGRLTSHGVEFVIKPHIRFAGLPGEQATMFFLDPSGNALEFKAFNNIETQLFDTG
jgi:extradiol dioxygenase family protein